MDLHGDFAGLEFRSHLLVEHSENPERLSGSFLWLDFPG